jgi:hypothetical protein
MGLAQMYGRKYPLPFMKNLRKQMVKFLGNVKPVGDEFILQWSKPNWKRELGLTSL